MTLKQTEIEYKENTKTGTIWRSENIYVEEETGLILRSKDATDTHKYIIIKKTKHAELNKHKTQGIIKYTKLCRRNPQLKLEL